MAIGSVGWMDLTVQNAEQVRDFYASVVGWRAQPVEMGDYQDYAMTREGSEGAVGGICHARGMNADLPPVWLLYIMVADLDASLAEVKRLGGEQLGETRGEPAHGRFAIIRDPAGAVCALMQGAAT
jgi:hypothetical protein